MGPVSQPSLKFDKLLPPVFMPQRHSDCTYHIKNTCTLTTQSLPPVIDFYQQMTSNMVSYYKTLFLLPSFFHYWTLGGLQSLWTPFPYYSIMEIG